MARLISRYENTAFICPAGHVTKSWQWNSVASIACDACALPTERMYAQRFDNAQRFDPVIVARNPKTGEIRHLASAKSRVPHGYERTELRTRAEIDAACRQLDRQDAREHDRRQEREQRGREAFAEVDPLRHYIPQTPFGRELMDHANRQYQNGYTPRFAPGNFVQCLEYDRGNYDD